MTPAPTNVTATIFACQGGGPNTTGSVKVSWDVVPDVEKTSAAIIGVSGASRLGPHDKGYLEIYPVPLGTYRVDVVNLGPDPNNPGSYLPSEPTSITWTFTKDDCPKGNGK